MNIIVLACAMIGDVSRAFETFDEIPKLNLEPNQQSFLAVMEACSMRGHRFAMSQILSVMSESNVEFDTEAYGYLMKMAARCQHWSAAARLVDEATVKGQPVSPDVLAYVVASAKLKGVEEQVERVRAHLNPEDMSARIKWFIHHDASNYRQKRDNAPNRGGRDEGFMHREGKGRMLTEGGGFRERPTKKEERPAENEDSSV
mmetsp:Transcript_37852/g.82054  ORF Transcript_37852/g.82054 Transcript_37852/m.82054 type:complete len:202 (-) Transcript_37852:42-647(-)